MALYLPVSWGNLSCSACVFLALTSEVKKIKILKLWSQIPFWYCAGNTRVAFRLGRASVERVCQARAASQADAEHFIAHEPLPWYEQACCNVKNPDSRTTGSLGKKKKKKLCCNY